MGRVRTGIHVSDADAAETRGPADGTAMKDARPAPRLSLILCSRNDEYMGNARWRLQTTLNYIGVQAAKLDVPNAVEIVIADWGSGQPLREALALDPLAADIVSVVTV